MVLSLSSLHVFSQLVLMRPVPVERIKIIRLVARIRARVEGKRKVNFSGVVDICGDQQVEQVTVL